MHAGPSPWSTKLSPEPSAPPSPRRPSDDHPVGSRVAPDAQLLALCRAGDGRAWHELVQRYERLVFSVAVRDGLDVEDAADVTQTTFIALLDSIAELRSDERLGAWLMTVARRTAWRMRRRREREIGMDELPTVVDDRDWEQVAALHEGLARLGPSCRELLTALYLDPTEPSYEEIARRMDRAIGGIGPSRARCLQQLRTLMDGEEPR